jgi:hypothetical protein
LNIGNLHLTKDIILEYSNRKIIQQLMLKEKYLPFVRSIRGDGNCFYRAVVFGFLESIAFEYQKY